MRAVVSLAIAGLFSAAGCGDDVTSTAQGPEDFTRSLAGRCLAEDGKAWCFRPPWFTDDTPGHRAALGRADLFMNPVPPVDLGEDFQVLGLAGLGQGGDICALDTEGRLKCWADSMFDLDGLGDAEAFGDEAVEMGDALPFFDLGTEQRALGVAVSSPGWFCAWFEDGKAKCFGQEVFGVPSHDHSDVLGDAAAERGDAIPFVDLGTNVRIKSLHGAASRAQMCAITEEGGVKCWGKDIALFTSNVYPRRYFPDWGDAEEEMGDGLPYIDLGTGFVASHVAIGSRHTCALSESGEVRCWGVNQTFDGETEEPLFSGMCGRGDMESPIFWHSERSMGDNLVPVDLGSRRAVAIDTGWWHTCALLEDGSVKCWGHNGSGQLGQGDTRDRGTSPTDMGEALLSVPLGEGRRATTLDCNDDHCCVVRDDTDVVCWGQVLGMDPVGDEPGEMGDALEPFFVLP